MWDIVWLRLYTVSVVQPGTRALQYVGTVTTKKCMSALQRMNGFCSLEMAKCSCSAERELFKHI